MEEKYLHIVTLDVPLPANYGGMIDTFFRIKALYDSGIKIHLHCFTKDKTDCYYETKSELEKYCSSVHFYVRRKNLSGFSFTLPYIVHSRKNNQLLSRLKEDNYPILFDGIHCTYYLHKSVFNNRKILVRSHNAEFEYYGNLARNESNFLKRAYFLTESRLLKNYERAIVNKATLAVISQFDAVIFRQQFNAEKIIAVPAFQPYTSVTAPEGKGDYCLYHGNLSINENEEAVLWLLHNVFNDLPVTFLIAGKNPSKRLKRAVKENNQVTLIADPDDKQMQELIRNAHINILPSFNNTGVKLKLINALFNGRFCITNLAGAEGSELESICTIADNKSVIKNLITTLFKTEFTKETKTEREELLLSLYDNRANAKTIIDFIW